MAGLNGVILYFGLHVSNTIVGFIYVLFLIGFTIFPLFWPFFWRILWEYLPSILLIIASAIVIPIIKLIAKMICVKQFYISHRRSPKYFLWYYKENKIFRLFAVYEFILIYLGVAGGVVGGIIRFIIALAISSLTFNIITEPMLPFWVTRIINLDKVNKSYYSLIYMHHLQNNPIFVTAADIFQNSMFKNLIFKIIYF